MYVTKFREHFSCSYFPLPFIQLNENIFSSLKIIKLVDFTFSSSSYFSISYSFVRKAIGLGQIDRANYNICSSLIQKLKHKLKSLNG